MLTFTNYPSPSHLSITLTMHVQSGSNLTETYSELSCTIITLQATLCIRKQSFMAPPIRH
jgi:hypothetical protein